MSVSVTTQKKIWALSGCKCAFPNCTQSLIGPDNNIQGEVCHIVSHKKNGPRHREDYPGDIHGENNLIVLCSKHHKIIDDDPQQYTEEIVCQYKTNHENSVRLQMKQGIPWKVNYSQLYYMNIPRIELLAIQSGITFDEAVPAGECLHSLGYDLIYLMQRVSNLINQLSFCAVPANTRVNALQVGQIIEINETFRTKNVPSIDQIENNEYRANGDLRHDAHLYRNIDNFRVVLTIDPRWLATTTAFVNFKTGWIDVAGFGMITRIDIDQKVMHITPYVLGVPKSPLDELLINLSQSC